MNQNKRVLVGISGGVDSSVAALLLKQQGYAVEGLFAKVWQPDFIECTWRDEMRDAMRVCARLDIPFHFLDLEQEYKSKVGDYMVAEYAAGRTPNPDVMCNTHIKFGMIYDFAIKNGFDAVAMGHYAQNIDGQLMRGADDSKDQSYFLWNVGKSKFGHILFPIGNMRKSDVRAIAQAHNLFTADKKDSQGLCFMGPVDMKSFLKNLIETKSGNVLDKHGEVIGTHEGAQLYTIGERHGFSIDAAHKHKNDSALFVISKDIANNTVTVATHSPAAKEIALSDFNLLASHLPESAQVQFRYRQTPISVSIKRQGDSIMLIPEVPAEHIAVGQSAVLYDGAVCIGGGIVDKVVY